MRGRSSARVALSAGAVESSGEPDAAEPPPAGSGTAISPGRREAAQALYDELRMLGGDATDGIEEVQRRLLQHHVIATLLLDDVISREQPSELMQVSWNAINRLDPQRSPDGKLVGTELARLGAFLKPSWRANDWFWGRMDGASRLARLLLDPRRLFELGVSSAAVLEGLGIEDPCGELSFLDGGPDVEVPKFLPATTDLLIERLQLRIAARSCRRSQTQSTPRTGWEPTILTRVDSTTLWSQPSPAALHPTNGSPNSSPCSTSVRSQGRPRQSPN